MKQIPLTQGQFALVDDDDFERIGNLKWQASWCKKTQSYYAVRSVNMGGNKIKTLRLSRVILGLTDRHIKGDHINHDTLDNRRRNLRACTNAQNGANRKGVPRHNTSGFRGVTWHVPTQKWHARIMANRNPIDLGLFINKIDAVAAYAAANRECFVEFGGNLK